MQAEVVRQIFEWYSAGESVIGNVKLLQDQQILSPRGKDTWSKRTIVPCLVMKST
ncbi:recombinase family protein [Facklamia hominis]|uniref:recombinase family protein n=1 Tax=Facklamia hominis TaxID=178214 RepID=UPI0038B2C4CF